MHSDLSEKQYHRMLDTPIPKLVVSMALPAVISMMITVIYNTADLYFVSQINKSASAAVGAVYPIMAVIQAVGYGLAMGAGSMISRLLGNKEDRRASVYASSAFFLAIGAGTVVAVLGLCFTAPILSVLGCSETMLPYAVPYARLILAAAPLSCSSFVLNNALRSEGASTLSMWGLTVGGLLNLALDPLLIFTLDLGCAGAALATAISQTVSFLIFAFVFFSGRTIVKISPRLISKKAHDYSVIITTGLPTIFRQSLGSLSSALLNIQAVVYGDAAVSAVTIANKVYVLVRNMVLGVGQGFQPVAGYNFGAGNRRRTWRAFLFTSLLGSILCVAFAGGVAFLANPIMTWFSDDAEVIEIGVETLYFCCAVMPFMAISTYVNQMYQCLGFKAQATFLASCRQGIFFVPVIYLLPTLWSRVGVELSQPVADLLTFAVSLPFLFRFYRTQIQRTPPPHR